MDGHIHGDLEPPVADRYVQDILPIVQPSEGDDLSVVVVNLEQAFLLRLQAVGEDIIYILVCRMDLSDNTSREVIFHSHNENLQGNGCWLVDAFFDHPDLNEGVGNLLRLSRILCLIQEMRN